MKIPGDGAADETNIPREGADVFQTRLKSLVGFSPSFIGADYSAGAPGAEALGHAKIVGQ